MENKKGKKLEEKSFESWARKADEFFDDKEVEQFLQYCEDELIISRSKKMTKQHFQDLMAGFGY